MQTYDIEVYTLSEGEFSVLFDSYTIEYEECLEDAINAAMFMLEEDHPGIDLNTVEFCQA